VPDSVVDLAALAAQREQPGRALSAIVALRERLEELEEFQVENARREGWSWSEIAQPLKVSRQAVHNKYARRFQDARRGARGRMVILRDARRCVVSARREAAAFQHDSVGTDHLLLGLLAQDGIASSLAPLGVTMDRALFAVTELRGVRGRRETTEDAAGTVPISDNARAALEQSLREALRLGDVAIDAHHVLLALLRDPDGAAVQVLDRLGIPPAAVEERVREQ
jgi:Clp amino terminal domain, pathogenicity island component